MSLKNVVIGIAIIILTIFVVIYGINTLYNSPEYEDFCVKFKTPEVINDSERCAEIGGKWTSQDIKCITTPCPQGFCDRDFTCREEYEIAREDYSRNLFLINLPLGIIIIVLGTLMFKLEAVGAGLMGGGVGIILWGVGGFWKFADDWLKFLLSLVGLLILIWLAYYFNRKREKRKK